VFSKSLSPKYVVGLMSGTSVDSIDAVLVSITGFGISTRFKELAFVSYPYPKGFHEFVLRNSLPGSGTVSDICTLNILIAHFFADAVRAVAKKARVRLSDIDLIGSHGQTVHHIPVPKKLFGKSVRSTLQIGDPSTIAKLTGIVTVGDFRTGDMALGGQGAPLVPYFDFLAFRSEKKNRALLNIGGIANITALPKGCSVADVVALDTGPGNMVVDALMKRFYGRPYDKNGVTAFKGRILVDLMVHLLRHPYFKQKPPKSTGREMFGASFVNDILRSARHSHKQDIITTVSEFTPVTIYHQYTTFFRKHMMPDELIVSGGGAHNRFFMEGLRRYFAGARVVTSDQLGMSSDSKEALCFALLANETIHHQSSNVPSVTGASHPTVLGKICLP
jgi:anhydro-N-acetylmuramic acid kinase